MRRAVLLLFLLGAGACSTHIGDACEKHDDCSGVSGYCARVRICTRACDPMDLTSCPMDAVCAQTSSRAVCLRACSEGCADDERCIEGACAIAEPLEPLPH